MGGGSARATTGWRRRTRRTSSPSSGTSRSTARCWTRSRRRSGAAVPWSTSDADRVRAGCVAFHAIVHLRPAELASFAHEVHRVLRPEGLLLLSFHAGSETVHRDELFGAAVDLDFFFFECDAVVSALKTAGFRIDARVELAP